MTDVFRLSATEFFFQGGAVTNEMSHLRLGAGETRIPIMFGRTLDPIPRAQYNWGDMDISFGVAGIGWTNGSSIIEIDRTPLDVGV